ncbi:SagB/ThcOx family dehydrogenase [Hoyosella sp. YIM 151337]|uniref:SagB/ThcOx family dehydrogenase n=1 Tax=Hoyosella sp. YIM 151337 TaxID=2992742 RepID=UPI002235C441|nr:SagB/ThcOx family dehydrogenase [Hoyosella sp. YIM 151337]MCW4354460.1 SagB/ThcOx family dehydrogenase [Hoyosella sp. YIM 151337]
MERVKVAEYAAMFWKGGDLIWDDYLHHRQFALTAESESILRWFSLWRELSSIGEPGQLHRAIADRLLDEKVLIREGSAEHYEETRLLNEWGAWGAGTRYHHFASRTDESVTYLDPASDHVAFADKAKIEPPPVPVKTFPQRPITVTVPDIRDLSHWSRPGLVDALFARRSVRRYSTAPLPLDILGTLVDIAAGPIDVIENEETGSVVRKTSPSAGARSPLELYAHVNRVHGLQPAVYHYASARGGLERIRPPARPATLRRAVGDQPWLAQAPVLLIYTAVLERSRWRFESRRAYRDILLEAGHVSQTVLLTATAMGLGSVTATALCDAVIEQILGVDPISEPVLAVTALGYPG